MNARTHMVTALALALLCVEPVVSVAGEWAPFAGPVAAVLFAIASRFTSVGAAGQPNRLLAVLCPMVAAGILARGLGEYLVPGYPRVAAVLVLGLLALAVWLRAGCPNVVLWLAIGLAALTGVLLLGADFGIAPAAHPPGDTDPLWLFPAAILLLASASAAREDSAAHEGIAFRRDNAAQETTAVRDDDAAGDDGASADTTAQQDSDARRHGAARADEVIGEDSGADEDNDTGGGQRREFAGGRARAEYGLIIGIGLLFGLCCWASERQLGAGRLAISPAPLAEGLRAADADSLLPLLVVALVLLFAIGAHALLVQSARRVPVALPAVGAAAIAVVLPIGFAVVVAAALVVLRWAIGWLSIARAIR